MSAPSRNPDARANITVAELADIVDKARTYRQERNEARLVAVRLAEIAKRSLVGEIPDTAELFNLGLVVADWAPPKPAEKAGGAKS